MRRTLLIASILLVTLAISAQGDQKRVVLDDEQKLKNAYQATDDKSLVEFLLTRAKGTADPKLLDQLVERLGAKEQADRDRACRQLIAIGSPGVPKLRLAARNSEGAGGKLAKKLLSILSEERDNVTAVVVRRLASRRPAGTAEALLAYLPHRENKGVEDDLEAGLAAVAYLDGKPNPALVKALQDAMPERRAVACRALSTAPIAEVQPQLRKLMMSDRSPSVRLTAALALARSSDAKAISALISLLAERPIERAIEAEEFLIELAGSESPKLAITWDDRLREKARDAWAKWWLEVDGAKLLSEVKKHTPTEKSNAGLADQLSPSVPRLLALRKPNGAVEAILGIVPHLQDESLLQQLQHGLAALTFLTEKAHPAVLKALGDESPARRIAAATALASSRRPAYLKEVGKRLDAKVEKSAVVRLRIALALANAGEKEAVPVLIALLAEVPDEQAEVAEDFLTRLARNDPPTKAHDAGTAKERAAIWKQWWEDNKKTILFPLAPEVSPRVSFRGLVLLIQPKKNQIVELDRNNKPRLTMTSLLNPLDAQILGSRRVLICEEGGKRVTERDLEGTVIWEHKLPFYPMQAERLRNGNTFCVGGNQISEVNKAKREVFEYTHNFGIHTARRLPNGQIVVLTAKNELIRLDRNGKQLRTVRLPRLDSERNEILDNGNVIVPLGWNNTITEYDRHGKEVWTATVQQPTHCFRQPNGNTLVAVGGFPSKFVELNRTGKVVREHVTSGLVYRIKAR